MKNGRGPTNTRPALTFLPAILAPILFLPAILVPLLASRSHPSGPHDSVAPWDYPDQPNTVKIANPGSPMPDPDHIVRAENNEVKTSDGITIRLNHVSKGNTSNWLHWWTPEGGPLPVKPENSYQIPDQPPLTPGRKRQLSFSVQVPDAQNVEYIGYVPDGALKGLTEKEKIGHGWDIDHHWDLTSRIFQTTVTVDDLNASRFLFGIARGPWKTVATAKNPLGTGDIADGQIIAEGPWGSVNYQSRPKSGIYDSKRFNGVEIELHPTPDPVNNQLRLRGFDADGVEIPVSNNHDIAFVGGFPPPKKPVASFAVEERPYTYYEFDGIHYDPDPALWKGFVWGPNQPTESVQIGGLTAELRAISDTEPSSDSYSPRQYVAKTTYTVDNKIWKDSSEYAGGGSTPMTEPFPVFNPKTNRFDPPKELPQPMLADVKLSHGPCPPDEEPDGRVRLFGSNSDQPGVDLHADWNRSVIEWSHYGELQKLPGWLSIPFSLKPNTKYAQIQVSVASGPWKKLVEVTPSPADIKTQGMESLTGPQRRKFTLMVGSKISVTFCDATGKMVTHTLSDKDLTGMDLRTFARMKSGQRLPLRITEYFSNGVDQFCPGYDFDRDATDTEGDVIALPQIEAFEIEARPIKQGYLVYKVPTSASGR